MKRSNFWIQSRKPKPKIERPPDLEAMREAIGVYLTSRETTTRDLAFVFLPSGETDPTRNGADLIIWRRDHTHIISLLIGKESMGQFRQHFHDALHTLRHRTHVVRAETPFHAVEQIVSIVDDKGGFS